MYKYHGVYPTSAKFNNVTAETGKVVEGVTTVVYQYDYEKPVKPSWHVPSNAPTLEVPEYEGGVSPVEPPVLEVPKYEGGVSPIEPLVLEVPEYEGGVSPIEPPVLEVPEYKGGVSSAKPPIFEMPGFEGGAASDRPTILEVPEYKGSVIEPIPNPKDRLQKLPTVEDLEERIVTLGAVNRKKSEKLPNTGAASSDVATLGFMTMLAALGISVGKRRKEK